jgi:hypothetical protein
MQSSCKFIHSNEQGRTQFCDNPTKSRNSHCPFHDHVIFNADLWNLPFYMIGPHIIDKLYQWIIHHPRQFSMEYYKYLLKHGRNSVYSLLINPVEMNTYEVPISYPRKAIIHVSPPNTVPMHIPEDPVSATNKTLILVDEMPVLVDDPPVPMDEISTPMNYILPSDDESSMDEMPIHETTSSVDEMQMPIPMSMPMPIPVPIPIPMPMPIPVPVPVDDIITETNMVPIVPNYKRPIAVIKYSGDYDLTLENKFIVRVNNRKRTIRVVGHYDFENIISTPLTQREREIALSKGFIIDDFIAMKPSFEDLFETARINPCKNRLTGRYAINKALPNS